MPVSSGTSPAPSSITTTWRTVGHDGNSGNRSFANERLTKMTSSSAWLTMYVSCSGNNRMFSVWSTRPEHGTVGSARMDEPAATSPAARRIALPWLLTPYVALVVVGYVADIIGPHLITTHPLLQMFLNPRNRYLLLASPHVAAVPFYVV